MLLDHVLNARCGVTSLCPPPVPELWTTCVLVPGVSGLPFRSVLPFCRMHHNRFPYSAVYPCQLLYPNTVPPTHYIWLAPNHSCLEIRVTSNDMLFQWGPGGGDCVLGGRVPNVGLLVEICQLCGSGMLVYADNKSFTSKHAHIPCWLPPVLFFPVTICTEYLFRWQDL
jgi:hypothetical protein